MGLFSKFEDKAENLIEGAGSSKGGIEPVKIAKRAGKEMQREKMIGVGHEYAPTLYNVLVSPADEQSMIDYYPTLAGEVETYLSGLASQQNLVFDCPPLVRFIVDENLKRGRFDVVAENVSPSVVEKLRHEEMVFYGLEEPEQTFDETYDDAYPEDTQRDPFAPSDNYYPQEDEFAPQGSRYNEPTNRYSEQNNPAYPATYENEHPEFADDAKQKHNPHIAEGAAIAGAAANVADHIASPAPAVIPAANIDIQSSNAQAQQAPQNDAAKTVLLGHGGVPVTTPHLIEHTTNIEHALDKAHITIGRSLQCDIVISDPGVSRLHAEMIHDDNGWIIRDAKSTNGTHVNDVQVQQSQVFDGDLICLGNSELTFTED